MYSIFRNTNQGGIRLCRSLAVLAIAGASGQAPAAPPLGLPDALQAVFAGGAPESVDQLRSLQAQVRRVVAASRPVTVGVELGDSIGSGVVVSGDGLVLTAAHVCVEPGRQLTIRFPDESEAKGVSLGVHHRLDCGMARITDPPPKNPATRAEEWPQAPLASEAVEPGEWVVGLGQPNGFVVGRAPPVRLGRVLYVSDEAINTDATLVGGDSGGPLLNLRGEVVGIHSKIGEQVTSNYHVPVDAFRDGWDALLAGRMIGVPDGEDPRDWRPQIGLAVRDVAEGLRVTQVFPKRAGAKAGVAVGDVIRSLAGEEVTSAEELRRVLDRQSAFDRTTLTVLRDGKAIELEVWLGRVAAEFPGSSLPSDGLAQGER